MLCKKAAWKVCGAGDGWGDFTLKERTNRNPHALIPIRLANRGCAVSKAVDAQTRKECFEIFVDHLDDVGRVIPFFLPLALVSLIHPYPISLVDLI